MAGAAVTPAPAGNTASAIGSTQTSATSSFRQASHQRPQRSDADRRGNSRQRSHTAAIATAPWRDARPSAPRNVVARFSISALLLPGPQPGDQILELRELAVRHLARLGQIG